MANSSRVLVDFVIVATLVALVTIEVDLVVLLLNILEAEGLVPALGEDIERDLATNGELQVEVGELRTESSDESISDLGGLIEVLESITLLSGAVSADGRNVHHTVTVLKESSSVKKQRVSINRNIFLFHLPLDGNVQVGDVLEREVDQSLEVGLTEVRAEVLPGELNTVLHGEETVLREAVLALLDDVGANLLRDLGEVGATDDTDVDALGDEGLKGLDHLGLDSRSGGRQRLVDVEEHDNFFATFHDYGLGMICVVLQKFERNN